MGIEERAKDLMNWNCTITEERLSDSLDGLLSREEVAALSAHTAGCADCQELIATVGPLVLRMQRMEMVEEPEHLTAKILDATLGSRKTKAGWERLAGWATGLLQPRVAMGAGDGDGIFCDRAAHGGSDAE